MLKQCIYIGQKQNFDRNKHLSNDTLITIIILNWTTVMGPKDVISLKHVLLIHDQYVCAKKGQKWFNMRI